MHYVTFYTLLDRSGYFRHCCWLTKDSTESIALRWCYDSRSKVLVMFRVESVYHIGAWSSYLHNEKPMCWARTPRITIEQEHRKKKQGKERGRADMNDVCAWPAKITKNNETTKKGNNVKDRSASDILLVVVLSAQKVNVRSWKCNAGYDAQRQ